MKTETTPEEMRIETSGTDMINFARCRWMERISSCKSEIADLEKKLRWLDEIQALHRTIKNV